MYKDVTGTLSNIFQEAQGDITSTYRGDDIVAGHGKVGR